MHNLLAHSAAVLSRFGEWHRTGHAGVFLLRRQASTASGLLQENAGKMQNGQNQGRSAGKLPDSGWGAAIFHLHGHHFEYSDFPRQIAGLLLQRL